MKFSRRNFLRSFSLAAGGLWLPGARAQQFGGFTIPYLGGGVDTVWNGINAYWKLEEATGAIRVDSSGNGNHLFDTSAGITQAAGLIGNGGTSAGGAQCLEISDNAFVGAGPGVSFSLSTWVKSSGTANAIIAGKWASADNVAGQAVMDWSIGLNGGNNLVVNLHGPGFFDQGIIYGGSLNNTWQHLCVTFQAGTHVCKRYLNGSLVGTTTEIADIQRGAGSFALFNFGQVHAAGIVGSMDETGLWNRALSATEVAHLYNGGAGLAYPGSAPGPTLAGKWALQVGVNGGAAPSAGTLAAIDAFYNGLVADGTDGNFACWNAMAPDSLTACLTPQVVGTGAALWVNHNFVGGDLGINGLTGNAASKYLDTGLSIAGLPGTNCGQVIYAFAISGTGTQAELGAYDTNGLLTYLNDAGGGGNTEAFDGKISSNQIAIASPGHGYYCDSRVSSTDHRLFFANSTHAHAQIGSTDATSFSSTLPAFNTYAFAQHNGSGASAFCADTLSFIGILKLGLSPAQSAAVYARVQTLRTALGGGFV